MRGGGCRAHLDVREGPHGVRHGACVLQQGSNSRTHQDSIRRSTKQQTGFGTAIHWNSHRQTRGSGCQMGAGNARHRLQGLRYTGGVPRGTRGRTCENWEALRRTTSSMRDTARLFMSEENSWGQEQKGVKGGGTGGAEKMKRGIEPATDLASGTRLSGENFWRQSQGGGARGVQKSSGRLRRD